jgi:hypothetical protein
MPQLQIGLGVSHVVDTPTPITLLFALHVKMLTRQFECIWHMGTYLGFFTLSTSNVGLKY